MPRLNISDLKRTRARCFWPSLAPPSTNGWQFESEKRAAAEDALRARLLQTAADQFPDDIDCRAARRLSRRLNHRERGKKPPKSLASSVYARRPRECVFSHLWQLVDSTSDNVSTFTVIKRGWEFFPQSLETADPRELLAELRSDLNRRGASDASGWLIAWIHGEYDCSNDLYRLHVHGVASGGMVDVVDRLREGRNYVSLKGAGDGVTRRVVLSRKSLTDLPYPLTYCLKPYWPKKHVGEEGAPGEGKRNRQHLRIPEPYHTEVLLWLDRWTLADITLLVGIGVGKDGFRLTRKCP